MSAPATRRLWLGVLGVMAIFGGILLSDGVFDDPEVVLPEPAEVFTVPARDAADTDDPGAVVGLVEVSASAPLFEDATALHPTVFDEQGEPAADGPTPGSGDGPAGEPEADSPGGEGGSDPSPADSGPRPVLAVGEEVQTVARFLDFCSEDPSLGCPVGVGATVLFAGETPMPPPLRINVIPETMKSDHPGLRCDPGYPTETFMSLLVLSNKPLTGLDLRLSTENWQGPNAQGLRSSDSEAVPYEQRVKAGQPTEPTVAAGVHTCLGFRLDRKTEGGPDRKGPFTLFIQARASAPGYPQELVQEQLDFIGIYDVGTRPQVRIYPQDQNRAYVIVPQQALEESEVWVIGGYQDCSVPGPKSGSEATRSRIRSWPDVGAPDFPWDRSYGYYSVWDLNLRHSEYYTLCVWWKKEGRVEGWRLETPDGWDFVVSWDWLGHARGAAPGALRVTGCPEAGQPLPRVQGRIPHVDVEPNGQILNAPPLSESRVLCYTGGWPVPQGGYLELRAEIVDPEYVDLYGANQVYGVVRRPLDVQMARCGAHYNGPWITCGATLEWRNPKVLCGGGLDPDPTCGGDPWFRMGIQWEAIQNTTTKRPDPKGWGITKFLEAGTVPLL